MKSAFDTSDAVPQIPGTGFPCYFWPTVLFLAYCHFRENKIKCRPIARDVYKLFSQNGCTPTLKNVS